MHKHKFSLVTCARWEETEIQEWVEYHKSIGFGHVYLYSNDDNPTALFRAIAPYAYGSDPFVTFRHWPRVGDQVAIYLDFLRTYRSETEWFSFLDVDEFFVLKGVNDVARFMRDYESSVDCLYFNWVIYGNSGKIHRENTSTLTSYRRRAPWPDSHTKMLCRAAVVDPDVIQQNILRGSFWHCLDNYKLPGVRCRDVLHFPMDGYSADFPTTAKPFLKREGFSRAILERAYIAHFQFKSEEDLLRRWRRGGFANGEMWRQRFDSGEYKSFFASNNAVYDTYLAEYWYRYTAPAMRFGRHERDAGSPYENVALNKPSWQSSVYEAAGTEPPRSQVSGAGNNGRRTGFYGFHTKYEAQPWWIVDLLAPHRISSIHIYNRRDNPAIAARANEIDVLVSRDGETWVTLLSRTDPDPFGLDSAPLVVNPKTADPYRFVKIALRTIGFLHLDEVEVHGEVVDEHIAPQTRSCDPFAVSEPQTSEHVIKAQT